MLGRALAYAYLGTSLWLAGYLYGHHVGLQQDDDDPDLPVKGPVTHVVPEQGHPLEVAPLIGFKDSEGRQWAPMEGQPHAEGNGG